MEDSLPDPLALGQRLVAVLEAGRRTATYKLAALTALIDYSVEHLPAAPEEELAVPVSGLAERVMELYWQQVRPLEGTVILRQSTQPAARILRATEGLRAASGVADRRLSLETARQRVPIAFEAAVADVSLTLARQPLSRLQRVGQSEQSPFLYEDSWMHDSLTTNQLMAHSGELVLFPGVAHGLARLSGLLKPVIELLWVADVQRMNSHVLSDGPDLAAHLFGRDRVSLAPARAALMDAFGAHCFYCDARVGPSAPVDHVLAWSRVGLDGLSNLVVACARCNGDKSEALPGLELVSRALDRDSALLNQIAVALEWPTQRSRVVAAAHGLYRVQPMGTPLWTGISRVSPLDINWVPTWLETISIE